MKEDKEKVRCEVVGGQMSFSTMTSKLDQKLYAAAKAHLWMDLINERKRPKKWNKPTKNGTKVTFRVIKTQEEIDLAFEELQVYLNEINEDYGLDFSIVRGTPLQERDNKDE